ncbi:hypothetical protein [Kitasatospora sp. DSM 101779]|uniref:hypothetical protein n=1 Tax=Kitasatospora sp. DSM 101779 TaxID=2853165 RepID=UPI0021DB406C|nr:hypothetical protein [Kitasatospora sp. DSM 101779]MCU7823748.1 hypothetical protein [Kitasatospora sp. DSM 101779]
MAEHRLGARHLARAGAAALTVLGVGLCADRSGGPLLLVRLCNHPVVLGTAAIVLFTAALVRRARSPLVRAETALVGVVLATVLPAAQFLGFFWDGEVTVRQAAPGRPDRVLVVEEAPDLIDTLTRVHVDDAGGLVERRWHLGEFTDDDPSAGLAAVEWDGPDRLRVTIGGRVHLVDLDPDSGRPARSFHLR